MRRNNKNKVLNSKNENYEEEYHTEMHKHLLTDDNYFNARAEMALEDYFKPEEDFNLEDNWVLEFGCGLGQNIAKIPNAVGFDVSKFALRMAQDRGVKVITKLSGSDNVYDYVFCRHVLEHLENPLEFLKLMRACLINTGKLILILPMEKHGVVRLEKSDNQHLYSWNFRCINNLLFRAGFQPVHNKVIKRTGFKKLLPLRKISFGTYKFATHLAALINGNKEMMIVAAKKNG
jgi:SAM-dependent methyltransferase